jgi:hypothetical protein
MKRIVAAVICLSVFYFTVPASAINLSTQPAEMCEGSSCDRAGTINIYFSATDMGILEAWLASNEIAFLRFTLSGTDMDPMGPAPSLCADIQYDNDGNNDPADDTDDDFFTATPFPISWNNVVSLAEIGDEVTDLDAGGSSDPDLTAFAHGSAGNQYFEVIITDVDPDQSSFTYGADPTEWPRLTVGLDPADPGISIGDGESHAIHVNVAAFSTGSRLEASLDTYPPTLTYTPGDEQIGYFITCSAIPTLSEYGMAAFILLIIFIASRSIRKRDEGAVS